MKKTLMFLIALSLIAGFIFLIVSCSQQISTNGIPGYTWKGHTVLVEMFTSDDCTSCQPAALALEQFVQDYGISKMILAEYHVMYDDPYKTAEAQSRWEYFYEGPGIPLVYFDGVTAVYGYGAGLITSDDYKRALHPRLDVQKTLSLEAQANLTGDKVTVSGSVSNESGTDLNNLTLNFLILRDYSTEKHHYVFRDMMTMEVSSLPAGNSTSFISTSESLTETTSLAAVVFVQKSDKEILESVYKIVL